MYFIELNVSVDLSTNVYDEYMYTMYTCIYAIYTCRFLQYTHVHIYKQYGYMDVKV